mmetsp:Transcript_13751/g.38926  ORF Transcript_13751/g.38926 Transcript_13751/m.38926 type:complete len:374 (-) Transcript_13751:132-1253(-)
MEQQIPVLKKPKVHAAASSGARGSPGSAALFRQTSEVCQGERKGFSVPGTALTSHVCSPDSSLTAGQGALGHLKPEFKPKQIALTYDPSGSPKPASLGYGASAELVLPSSVVEAVPCAESLPEGVVPQHASLTPCSSEYALKERQNGGAMASLPLGTFPVMQQHPILGLYMQLQQLQALGMQPDLCPASAPLAPVVSWAGETSAPADCAGQAGSFASALSTCTHASLQAADEVTMPYVLSKDSMAALQASLAQGRADSTTPIAIHLPGLSVPLEVRLPLAKMDSAGSSSSCSSDGTVCRPFSPDTPIKATEDHVAPEPLAACSPDDAQPRNPFPEAPPKSAASFRDLNAPAPIILPGIQCGADPNVCSLLPAP